MAQKRSTSGKRSSSSKGRSSSSSSRKRSASSAYSRQTSRASSASTESSTFGDYFHAFTKTRAFVPVAAVVILTLLILIDLLIAWNNYDRFFKILGFELLIAGIIWVIGLVLSFGESTPSSGE